MAYDKNSTSKSPGRFQPGPSDAKAWLDKNIPVILNIRQSDQVSALLENIKTYMYETRGKITTSQLRNIFSKVKMPGMTHIKLQLVRPHLAYIAARQGNLTAREVVEFLEKVVSEVKNDTQVEDFVTFFEAVVAYHKFYNTEKN